MHFRQRFLLPDDMLAKIDRMSMAASLEVRTPLLDASLARVAMALPNRWLINGGVKKFILREAVRDLLPAEVFSHPKTGFSIPLHMFQNTAYLAMAGDLLSGSDGVMGLFTPAGLQQVLQRGLSRKADAADFSVYRASHQLWALLQLAAWARMFRVAI